MKTYELIPEKKPAGDLLAGLPEKNHVYFHLDGENRFEGEYCQEDQYLIRQLNSGEELVSHQRNKKWYDISGTVLIFEKNNEELFRIGFPIFFGSKNITMGSKNYPVKLKKGIKSPGNLIYTVEDKFELKIPLLKEKPSLTLYSDDSLWSWIAIGTSYFLWHEMRLV